MFRAVLATVVGLVVMIALVFALMAGAYAVLGPDRAYQPGTYETSTAWIAAALALGFAAALVGGRVAAKLGGHRGVRGLIAMVLVLGALTLAGELMRKNEAPAARPSEVTLADSMKNCRQPLWVCIANPLIGVLGVALGAASAGKRKR